MYVIFKKMVETPLIITDLPYDFVVQHRFFHLPSSKIPFDSFQFLDYLKAQVIIAVEIVGDFEGKDIIEKYYKEDKEYLLQKSSQEVLQFYDDNNYVDINYTMTKGIIEAIQCNEKVYETKSKYLSESYNLLKADTILIIFSLILYILKQIL